jgi:hypothetical protein
MQIRSIVASLALLAATSSLYATARPESFVGETSIFSIKNKTDVPGMTLNPGQYAILIVDQYSDRMIVRVENQKTKEDTIFLGIPQPAISESRGPVQWQSGPNGAPAMRGFVFSPASKVEFVYPKADAVAIATKNAAQIVAVDPASEKMPPMNNMSKDDMKMISLWALSLTPVGPDNKAPTIAAKKYEPDPTQVASLEQPRMGNQSSDAAPIKRKPVVARLPHTASPVGLIAICGMFSLLAAALLQVGSMAAIRFGNSK